MTRTPKDDYADSLREAFPPGSTARTILRHVSSSGMTRAISVIGVDCDDARYPLHDWSYAVASVTGRKLDPRHEGVKCSGAGMDMGFDLVYSMSRALYPDGYDCPGESCMSGDHVNGPTPDRDYTPGHARHADGGYAVSQRWL